MNKPFHLDSAIRQLEQAAIKQSLSIKDLIGYLQEIDAYLLKGSLTVRRVARFDKEHWYTRLASAVAKIIVNPAGTKFGLNEIILLCQNRQVFHNIFYASGFRGFRHLVATSGTLDQNGKLQLRRPSLLRILAITPLDDLNEELVNYILNEDSLVSFTLSIALLADDKVLSVEGDNNKVKLIEGFKRFEGLELNSALLNNLGQISNAWMFCSYASSKEKHSLKRVINSILTSTINSKINLGLPNKKSTKARPVALIPLERFKRSHAMYRCYSKFIEKIKGRFKVIALVGKEDIDNDSETLFDDVIKFDAASINFNNIVSSVVKLSPDLIFYPSVGMSAWTVVLANLRLAKRQVASLGHPATTMSSEIDFIFTPELMGDQEKIFSERLLIGGKKTNHSLPNMRLEELQNLSQQRERMSVAKNGTVNIAINASKMKLSGPFLKTLRRLDEVTNNSIKFHFFPSVKQNCFDSVLERLKNAFGEQTVVYPTYEYNDFVKRLAQCDLSLAPFPFGNSNGTVDAMCLGIPVIAFYSDEPAAQTDYRVIKDVVSKPDILVARDVEDYIVKAVKIIDNDDYREELSKEIRDKKFFNMLEVDKPDSIPTSFSKAVDFIMDEDDSTLFSKKRVFFEGKDF